MSKLIATLVATALAATPSWADEPDAGPAEAAEAAEPASAMATPGRSSRLFFMPIAQNVGAYELSLSYEGSLLEEPGVLSSAGVFALGIGDIAQIEYRHASAIGLEGGNIPLPTVGAQFLLPIPPLPVFRGLVVALRYGIPQEEVAGDVTVSEHILDYYGVTRLELPGAFDLHLGLRVSSAQAFTSDPKQPDDDRTLWLPALGLSREFGTTEVAVEVGGAPHFTLDPGGVAKVERGVTGRMGVRWRLHPRFLFDASAGYLGGGGAGDDLLEWDIRLGGEVFVPWGAIACRTVNLFCN